MLLKKGAVSVSVTTEKRSSGTAFGYIYIIFTATDKDRASGRVNNVLKIQRRYISDSDL